MKIYALVTLAFVAQASRALEAEQAWPSKPYPPPSRPEPRQRPWEDYLPPMPREKPYPTPEPFAAAPYSDETKDKQGSYGLYPKPFPGEPGYPWGLEPMDFSLSADKGDDKPNSQAAYGPWSRPEDSPWPLPKPVGYSQTTDKHEDKLSSYSVYPRPWPRPPGFPWPLPEPMDYSQTTDKVEDKLSSYSVYPRPWSRPPGFPWPLPYPVDFSQSTERDVEASNGENSKAEQAAASTFRWDRPWPRPWPRPWLPRPWA